MGLLTACSNDVNNNESLADKSKILIKASSPTHVKYSCDGDGCTGLSYCTISWLGGNVYSCCEGCYLSVQFISGEEPQRTATTVEFEDDIFKDDLKGYLDGLYPNGGFAVHAIEYETNGSLYYVIYSYSTPTGGEETVLIYAAPGGSTTIVDCSGSCDNSEEKCVEVAVIEPDKITASCSCESDNCSMNITQ